MRWYVYKFQVKNDVIDLEQTRICYGKCILEAILDVQTKLMLEFGTSFINIVYVNK